MEDLKSKGMRYAKQVGVTGYAFRTLYHDFGFDSNEVLGPTGSSCWMFCWGFGNHTAL